MKKISETHIGKLSRQVYECDQLTIGSTEKEIVFTLDGDHVIRSGKDDIYLQFGDTLSTPGFAAQLQWVEEDLFYRVWAVVKGKITVSPDFVAPKGALVRS